jgi:hypothetical protein
VNVVEPVAIPPAEIVTTRPVLTIAGGRIAFEP